METQFLFIPVYSIPLWQIIALTITALLAISLLRGLYDQYRRGMYYEKCPWWYRPGKFLVYLGLCVFFAVAMLYGGHIHAGQVVLYCIVLFRAFSAWAMLCYAAGLLAVPLFDVSTDLDYWWDCMLEDFVEAPLECIKYCGDLWQDFRECRREDNN